MKTNKKGTKNRALRVITALIAAVILCGIMVLPMTAYAYSDENAETVTGGALELDLSETYDPEQTPEPTPDKKPLTPQGNLTLVDDLSGEQTNDKQFITVITKSGAYFYIVIDRAGDKENVYFLNLVDEADLMAIMEGEKTVKPPAPVDAAPEQPATTDPEPTPEKPKSNNNTGMLIMLLIVAAAGGGAFYYFKVFKPKQGAKKGAGTPELDEFDFDADEDDFIGADTDGQYNAEYEGDGDEDIITDFTAEPDNDESEGE